MTRPDAGVTMKTAKNRKGARRVEEDLLRAASLKNTKKRRLILALLERAPLPLTAEELYEQARQATSISLSTVYRILGVCSEHGLLLRSVSGDGKTYYQPNRHQHKHELRCTVCHEVVPIDECPLEEIEAELAKKTGYEITGHTFELSGICPRCAGKRKKEGQP